MTNKSFNELRAKMSPERRARNTAATKAMLAELPHCRKCGVYFKGGMIAQSKKEPGICVECEP